jgi:hypothetical protein
MRFNGKLLDRFSVEDQADGTSPPQTQRALRRHRELKSLQASVLSLVSSVSSVAKFNVPSAQLRDALNRVSE